MNQYNQDTARNILSLTIIKQKSDPHQTDDDIFKAYFTNVLSPSFQDEYGIDLKYGTYQSIIKTVSSIL